MGKSVDVDPRKATTREETSAHMEKQSSELVGFDSYGYQIPWPYGYQIFAMVLNRGEYKKYGSQIST